MQPDEAAYWDTLGDLLANLIKDKLGTKLNEKLRVRADTFGYLQRAFAGNVSKVDRREARKSGFVAAAHALAGDLDGSIAIQRKPGSTYDVTYQRIKLTDVAAKTQTLDPKYIVDGCDIHESFRDYLAPIVGPLPEIETL